MKVIEVRVTRAIAKFLLTTYQQDEDGIITFGHSDKLQKLAMLVYPEYQQDMAEWLASRPLTTLKIRIKWRLSTAFANVDPVLSLGLYFDEIFRHAHHQFVLGQHTAGVPIINASDNFFALYNILPEDDLGMDQDRLRRDFYGAQCNELAVLNKWRIENGKRAKTREEIVHSHRKRQKSELTLFDPAA